MLCLLVEDDESSLLWCTESLEMLGLKVIVARNGFEALEEWDNHKPPLIVLDWMMPKMDGIEFLKRLKIKTLKEGDKFPKVIMSSCLGEECHFQEAKEAGAFTYLCKPYTHRDLEAKIGLLMNLDMGKEGKSDKEE